MLTEQEVGQLGKQGVFFRGAVRDEVGEGAVGVSLIFLAEKSNSLLL